MSKEHVIVNDFTPEETRKWIAHPLVSRAIDLLHHEVVIAGPSGLVSAPLTEVQPYGTVSQRYLGQFGVQERAQGEAWLLRDRMDMLNVVENPDREGPEVLYLKEVQLGDTRLSLMSVLKEILGKEEVRALDGIPLIGANSLPRKVSLVRSSVTPEVFTVALRKTEQGAALLRALRV